ncbi:MAG: helix-turn-helix domain-containing protein [candidate division Zixibacteria bacterium]|nr:helix-turn-helix domain-containing protein [candidate division Zixibacteria bacterium]
MEALLSPNQMAERLGVRLSTIYQWTHTRFIPHIKLGRLVRFREGEILKCLTKKSLPGKSISVLKTRYLSF